jgi:putative ABC transport system substrate-binding protein
VTVQHAVRPPNRWRAHARFNQLGRREFITFLGGAAVARPLGARAQQAVKVYRIGILSPELPPPGFLEALQQELRELGYVEGQNIGFEVRSAEGYSQRLPALANLLVG